MVKGVSIKFVSYEETVSKLLKLIKFEQEMNKHERIVLKPHLETDKALSTPAAFVEPLVRFCMQHRTPGIDVFIAEGVNGADTHAIFEEQGYKALAEKYGVALVDLNKTESTPIAKNDFIGFEKVYYPSILQNSLVITLPALREDEDLSMIGAITSMMGAFPAQYYKSIFSRRKNKLDSYPLKYQIHDIIMCKMPDFTIIDAHEKGYILAGQALDMDKQAAKLLGKEWKSFPYVRMLAETLTTRAKLAKEQESSVTKES